jgi:hypothetical protein
MKELANIKHLPIDLNKFGFVEREKDSAGNTVKNRCGRDFLYYTLNYFYPTEFSPTNLCPVEIEKKKIFGIPMPAFLVWTNLSFIKVPKLFRDKNLGLEINGLQIKTFFDFAHAMLFAGHDSFDKSIERIKSEIGAGNVVGIDIAVKLNGLADHVMFVYGYDDSNLYVIDTHKASEIDYEKITPSDDNRHIMKLPLAEIRKKWLMIWNRVWIIKPLPKV